jgi:hypothetical protein
LDLPEPEEIRDGDAPPLNYELQGGSGGSRTLARNSSRIFEELGGANADD